MIFWLSFIASSYLCAMRNSSAKSAPMISERGSRLSAFSISPIASVLRCTAVKYHAYHWCPVAYPGLNSIPR
jgi:hypothetical protein